MVSKKTLNYLEILFVVWVLLFGLVGILFVGSGDGKNIPPEAWLYIGAMAVCAFVTGRIRNEKRRRDHEEFLERHPHMRSLYK